MYKMNKCSNICTCKHHSPYSCGEVLSHDAEEVVLNEIRDDSVETGSDVDEDVLLGLTFHGSGVAVVEHLDHVTHNDSKSWADESRKNRSYGSHD